LKGGFETRVTRCGYTGEDGFEISMKWADTEKLARVLLGSTAADVQPCGLGARDSLRLEAGLCLYGHDLDTTIDPIQAGLLWTVGPKGSRRRIEQGFAGAHNILKPDGGPLPKTKKRVGFMGHSQPIREGAPIYDMDGQSCRRTPQHGGPLTRLPRRGDRRGDFRHEQSDAGQGGGHGLRAHGVCQGRHGRPAGLPP
jgi:aminomethyltransferase